MFLCWLQQFAVSSCCNCCVISLCGVPHKLGIWFLLEWGGIGLCTVGSPWLSHITCFLKNLELQVMPIASANRFPPQRTVVRHTFVVPCRQASLRRRQGAGRIISAPLMLRRLFRPTPSCSRLRRLALFVAYFVSTSSPPPPLVKWWPLCIHSIWRRC